MNDATLNSITLNASGATTSSFVDLRAQISVASPAFVDLKARISVAAANFVDLRASITVASGAFKDGPTCYITVSNYKWLTSTLLAAQQQAALRPYFTVQIKDDSLVPTTKYTDPGQPLNGEIITAPDGSILAVGRDTAGNLGFWKLTDASQLANWTAAPSVIIAATGTWSTQYNAVISVSDYIGGTYTIDIYYLDVVAGFLEIEHARSTNGGTSFTATNGVSSTVASGTSDNVYLAAGKPTLNSDGNTDAMVFALKNNGSPQYVINYWYSTNGSAVTPFSTRTQWSPYNIDSQDWSLHSFDVFFINNIWYLYFSGYHTVLENSTTYSIYLTKLIKRSTLTAKDIWTKEKEIISSLSSASQNQNNFTLPKVNYDGKALFLTFKGVTVDTINESGIVTTKTNFYNSFSTDFENFTYPVQYVFNDGTEFSDTNSYSFAKQGSNHYLAGSGKLWGYTRNNITADVTNDILSYKISESAGAPSSLSLSIGNQNGQWIGPSPTQSGAAAIAKNKKIYLYQGYYNASGVPEVVPRNTYFIDDIQQNVSSNRNDLTIQARDAYKKLRTTISRYPFNYKGPDFYVDNFDGSTIGNWNQATGSWIQESITDSGTMNFMLPQTAPGSGTEFDITLSGINIKNPASMVSCIVKFPDPSTTNKIFIYPFWVDSKNWLRLKIEGNGSGLHNWAIEVMVNGSLTPKDSQNGVNYGYSGSVAYGRIYIRNYQYQNFMFFLDSVALLGLTGVQTLVTPGNPFANTVANGEINISGSFPAGAVTTIAFGCDGWAGMIGNLQFSQYIESNDLREQIVKLGTKSGILNYKPETEIEDYLFVPTQWSGSFTVPNRILTITAGNLAMRNVGQISDSEVEFDAKISQVTAGSAYGFDFVFRNQSTANSTNTYLFRTESLVNPDTISPISPETITAQFRNESTVKGDVLMTQSTENGQSNFDATNNLRFDLTQWHHYKISFVKGWMYAYIDNILVLAWYDNNTSVTYSLGYIGFQAMANTKLEVKNIISPTFYQQINNFAINPGDDFDTAMSTVSETVAAWNFTDLFARFKSVLLKSTDASNYTYQNQLYSQVTDNSDKEFVNQVTVIGLGVSAVARSNTSIGSSLDPVRDEIIVDYKITTLQDAQTRAQYELTNFNKFNAQSDPKHPNNVGAELFDVVTIINSDSNTNTQVRVYTQDITMDGSSNEYSLSPGAGQVT